MSRTKSPYLCRYCGETTPSFFHKTNKQFCKKCKSIEYRNKKNGLENTNIVFDNIWIYYEPGAKQRLMDYIYNDVIPYLNTKIKKRI